MMMQHNRQRPRTTNRNIEREERSPNQMLTAITIGAVVLLLAITFAADWLRTPDVRIASAPPLLSPNNDASFDTATIRYQMSEESQISARVLREDGGTVRSLMAQQKQSGGQHFLIWNGADDAGQVVGDGIYQVEITARGAMRASSASTAIQVDTTPPVIDLLNMQDGARVRDALLTVEGVTEPGAAVWVGNNPLPVTVDGQGHFRTQEKLTEGENRITVRAADAAGNTASLTRSMDLITAPPQVVINSPAEGAWVNTPKVTVEGQAPPGSMVKVNNQVAQVSADGRFQYDILFEEGDQRITITASDDVGNLTTVERVVHIQTRGPRLEVNVADGTTFSDPQMQLSGNTSPGATVTLNNRVIATGALGDFQSAINLNSGDNSFRLEARDQAGNTTALTRHVRYEIPVEPSGLERLLRNVDVLPAVTIPAVLLLSLLLGVFLYRQKQLAIALQVEPQNFTPGLPQEGKSLVLHLDLNQPAHVTLEVLDAAGLVQATLLNNRRRSARQHVFYWDGYDDNGRLVLPGGYTIRAIAGAPPIKVSSAVQVQVESEPLLNRGNMSVEEQQSTNPTAQNLPRRRVRQNRRRI